MLDKYKGKKLSKSTTSSIIVKFLNQERMFDDAVLAIEDAFNGNFKRLQEIGLTKDEFEAGLIENQ